MVLLAQRGKEPMKGVWSLPGGGVELGEAIVAAGAREVEEECGLAHGADFAMHGAAFTVCCTTPKPTVPVLPCMPTLAHRT